MHHVVVGLPRPDHRNSRLPSLVRHGLALCALLALLGIGAAIVLWWTTLPRAKVYTTATTSACGVDVTGGSAPPIAFVAAPKPAPAGSSAAIRQRNAVRSWLALHPETEVHIVGDDEAAEFAKELGVVSGAPVV